MLSAADSHELLGVIPAAGGATRLGRLPCSKEILPVGWELGPGGHPHAVVACEPLLRQMRRAGAARAFVVVGSGKWDVPAFLGDGQRVGLDLAYLVIDDSPSTAHTLARACRHLGEATVVLGFPDLVLSPDNALEVVVDRHRVGDVDVVLGLFPADDPSLVDMVETEVNGAVRRIAVKPRATKLRLTWLAAVWGARFTQFVDEWMAARSSAEAAQEREVYVGDIVQAAVAAGFAVVGVEIPDGGYADFGVPGAVIRRPVIG